MRELFRSVLTFAFVTFLIVPKAGAAVLSIPSVIGPLTIDGSPEEAVWKQAAVLSGNPDKFGASFPGGGETRVMVRSGYLCLSARLPEKGRIVARSTGRNPVWWREDRMVWTIYFRAFATSLSVSVNPLGAVRIDTSRLPVEPWEAVLASASIGNNGWSVEVAIPIRDLGTVGFLSAERIRVPRPGAPELRWYWPGVNRRFQFHLPVEDTGLAAPAVVVSEWNSRVSPPAAAVRTKNTTDSALASIPVRVWTQPEAGASGMWEKSLRARVDEAVRSERRDWEKVHSRDDWEKFRDRGINALRASLGNFPERTPLRPSITRRLDYGDGFIVEDLVYESRPGLVVAANLYLPARIEGRIPAIVVVHSHHAPKTQWELQDLGMTWARAGAAVLIMDQLGAGERLQSQPWPRESYYSRNALGMQLYLAGESLMKWMVWDLMRGIDLLLERPYIDPARVVMLGAVAGGGDPAAVAAALDRRIATVIPFNFGEAGPEEHFLERRRYDADSADPGWGEWESTRCLRLSIAERFFPWLICASVAPRGFIFSFELGWPHGIENEPIWSRYKKVVGFYGQPERLAAVDGFGPFPGPGEVTDIGVQHRQKIYPILKRWNDVPVPPEYHNPRPDEDLMCLTPDEAARRKPKTAAEIALRIVRQRLSSARAKRNSLGAAQRVAELRATLRAKLGRIDPPAQLEARVLWAKTNPRFVVEGIEAASESGIRIPFLLIRPNMAGSPGKLPVVVGFSQQGKAAFLSERGAEIEALLEKGAAICLVDVRGVGETEDLGRHGGNSTSLAATSLMLGDTALGARLRDARAVLRYLATRAGIDAERIVLWGDSTANVNPRDLMLDRSLMQSPGPQTIYTSEPLGGMLALLTALYEENVRAVVAGRCLISYESVLKDRFAYVPPDVIVPGILESADIPDIVAALGPRAVRVENAVDGRNRPLTQAEMEEEIGAVHQPSSVVLTVEPTGGSGTVKWIAAQCQK